MSSRCAFYYIKNLALNVEEKDPHFVITRAFNKDGAHQSTGLNLTYYGGNNQSILGGGINANNNIDLDSNNPVGSIFESNISQ